MAEPREPVARDNPDWLPDQEAGDLLTDIEALREGRPHIELKLDDADHRVKLLRDDEGDDLLNVSILRDADGLVEVSVRQEFGEEGHSQYHREYRIFFFRGEHVIDSEFSPIEETDFEDGEDVRDRFDQEIEALKYKLAHGLAGQPLVRQQAEDLKYILEHGRDVTEELESPDYGAVDYNEPDGDNGNPAD